MRTTHIALVLLLCLVGCSPNDEELPQLGIDLGKTSVSGLSAGAYMAGQIQVAHSKNIVGAGIVAGGPFGCAQSNTPTKLIPTAAQNFTQALEGCMSDKLRSSGIPDVPSLVSRAKDLAAKGEIEPLEGLTTDRSSICFQAARTRSWLAPSSNQQRIFTWKWECLKRTSKWTPRITQDTPF